MEAVLAGHQKILPGIEVWCTLQRRDCALTIYLAFSVHYQSRANA